MNIVILLAGNSTDFIDKGYLYPKYLLEIENEPIIQKVIKSLDNLDGQYNFIIRKEDNDKYYFSNTLEILSPKSNIIQVENITKGAVCTALFAIEKINNDDELLIINGDQLIKSNIKTAINQFRQKKFDGGIITFNSVHPRWSYVLLNDDMTIVETSEKRPISNIATAGCYYYKKGTDFIKSAMAVIEKDVQIGGLYYISSTYNEMILHQKNIGTYNIRREEYLSFATYQMYENYLSSSQKTKYND